MSFFKASGIEQWCLSTDCALRNAFEEAHSRATITRLDRHQLTRSAADGLLAVNAYSRISVARALCKEIADKLCVNEHWEHNPPIFFVTLIPKEGLVAADVRGIDLRGLKQGLRADLRGFSYVGAYEPAYYASLPMSGHLRGSQAICWHPHLLMWDVSTEEIATLIRKLHKTGHYEAVVEELKPVHAEQIANGELPDVVAYLLKPPSHAYRVQRYPWFDPEGQVRLKPDGSPQFYIQHKGSELRKGERVSVFHAMKHLRLDELLVAGSGGSPMRSRALRTAVSSLAVQR
jgi:hypothetical protein